MAYTVSQDFKDKIKDQTSAKSCLILFDDLFFSTADFTDSGVAFNQYFNTSDDLTFGDCPSDTLSFSVVANGGLKAYPFGDAKTYLGVQTGTESFTMPSGYNGYISYGGTVYSARDTGFYKDSTKLVDGVFFSVVSDGTYVWAHGEPGTYKHEIGSNTASKVMLITFMQRKFASGLSAVFASNTATVWTATEKQTFEYVPMGVYRVERPKSTIGQVVAIQDAYDRMSLFDKDASAFLASLSYPKTLSQIYTALCSYAGVSYVSSTFTYSTTSYASSPFPDSSCTLRDVLSWIAERARSVAHFNRVGALDLVWCGSVDAEQLTPDQVQADGFVVSEYVTEPVDSVLLKSTDGSSLSFGSTFNNPYQIFGNPFITTISSSDLDAYKAIPTYVPVELGVFECDPSIDLGDLIGTLGVSKKYVSFADAMGVALTDRYGVVFAEEADGAFSFPLMNREVQFIGAIRAVYTATGGKYREYDEDNTAYNALISVNETQLDDAIDSLDQAEIMDRLTGGSDQQGIYLYDGKIYINAEYIQAGTLSADYISGGTLSGVRVEATTGGIGGWGIHDASITSSVQAGDYAPTGERYFYYCYLNGFAATTEDNQSFLQIRKQTFSGSTGYDFFTVDYKGNIYTRGNLTVDGYINSGVKVGSSSTAHGILNTDGIAWYDSSNYGRFFLGGTSSNTTPMLILYDTTTNGRIRVSLTQDELNFRSSGNNLLRQLNGSGLQFYDTSDRFKAQYASDGHYFFPWSVGTASSGASASGFFEVGLIRIYGNYQNEPFRCHIIGRGMCADVIVQFSNSSTINGHVVNFVKAYGTSASSERIGVAWNRYGDNFKEFSILTENKQTYNHVCVDEVHIGADANNNIRFVQSNQFVDGISIESMNPTFASWV